VWYPLAQASRKLYPDAFKSLDDASGGTFPFTKEQLKAAHARCSSEWLAWERAHDAECSLKLAEVQDQIDRAQGPPSVLLRTRLAALEQQKLERYQQRYEEYVKTAKALAAVFRLGSRIVEPCAVSCTSTWTRSMRRSSSAIIPGCAASRWPSAASRTGAVSLRRRATKARTFGSPLGHVDGAGGQALPRRW
jgi:hypothetical protein